jgi:hypothetical protein
LYELVRAFYALWKHQEKVATVWISPKQ